MRSLILGIALAIANMAFAGTLRIMPLGDSITYGQGWNGGGYRAVLRDKLVEAGYDVDYVGTQTGNPGALVADIQHEGHPGWRVGQISDALAQWSAQIDGPNLILLLIGTNDCNSNHDTVMAQLRALLDEIKRVQPSAHVICGTIPPFLNGMEVGSNNDWVVAHNELVRAEVASRALAGDKISLAEIYNAVSPTEGMNDDRHPNETGYRAMATVWLDAIEAVFPDAATAGGETDLATVSCSIDETTGDRVTISFNNRVEDDATNLTHYAFSGSAFSAARAVLATDRRSVTVIGAAPIQAGVACTATVSGVRNAAGTKTAAPAAFDIRFLPYGARYYVPEAGQYRKVYEFTFTDQKYGAQAPVYDFDDHLSIGAYTRIAYYIELQKEGSEMQYLWVSMDKFTDDPGRIAIPTKFALTGEKEIFQQYVYNLKVWSNVDGVVPGDKALGNIEFWPYNYYKDVKLGIDGASSGIYDVDDSCNLSGSFACMQIHDTAALTPLFCYNNWGGTGTGGYDLGLGRQPGSGNTDWTQSGSGGTWTKRRHMEIYVLEDVADTTVPQVVSTSFADSRTSMSVVFDRPVLAESDMAAKASLSDGTQILSATLADPRTLVVTFPTLLKVEGVTLALEGLHAANPQHTAIPALALAIPGEDASFPYPEAPDAVVARVPDAAGYSHLFTIDIQPDMCINVKDGTTYVNKVDPAAYDAAHTVNNTSSAPAAYSRVGYFLELVDANDNTNWVWTAFDAFSADYGDIDIPTANPDHPDGGYVNGRFVANLDVDSNVDGIVKGTGLGSGVIEFTPWDYGGANARNVPNATGDYDFGDNLYIRVGNYACMQVHNYAAELANGSTGQVVWAITRFNGRSVGIGIGNSAASGNIDYTFDANAGNYKSRTLYVLVKPDMYVDESDDYEPMHAVVALDRRRVAVSFSDTVREISAQARYFFIPGHEIAKCEISKLDGRDIILTLAEPLERNASYTLQTQFPKMTNKTFTLYTERDLPAALLDGVEEIGDYTLLNDITIPYSWNVASYGADYRTDESRFGLPRRVERIAYALEVEDTDDVDGANYRWAWVSMDPFTDDPAKMGIPSITRGIHFQCYVDNISVRAGSSTGVAPIATGEWEKGNIEFTPSSYAPENDRGIPNADSSGNVFDWGDRLYGSATQAGHGCMQIHNYLAQDMIIGVSRLGNMVPGLNIGVIRNADGSVKDDGTWTANRHKLKVHEFRVFVRLAPEEPVDGSKGLGPVFAIQPESCTVRVVWGEEPRRVSLNAYAPNAVSYQWRKDGADIPGATGPVLEFAVANAGSSAYTVVAFADDGSYTTSATATVSGISAGLSFILR